MKSLLSVAAVAATVLTTGSAFAAYDSLPGAAFQDQGIREWSGFAATAPQTRNQVPMRRAAPVDPYHAMALGSAIVVPTSPPGASFQDQGIRDWTGFAPRY